MTLLSPKTLATAFLLFLLAGGPMSAQQYDREWVALPAPRVTLNASPASVSPGRPVSFAAQLSSSYPNIRFRFVFGDGSQTAWQANPVVTHTYQSAGNYKAFVDIGAATGGGVTRLGGSVRRLVQVTHAPAGPINLIINPTTAEIGRPVTLTVRTGSNNPNLRYRFGFGDRSPIGGWQSNPQALHVYPSSGTYAASVDVALLTDRGIQLQGSSRRSVTVSAPVALRALRAPGSARSRREARTTTSAKTSSADAQKGSSSKAAPVSTVPPASPSLSPPKTTDDSGAVAATGGNDDWRRYLWLLIPLAVLAFIFGKLFFGRPAVVGHADPGTSRVVDSSDLVSKSQVVTPASGSESEHEVSSSGPLVKNVRREDG